MLTFGWAFSFLGAFVDAQGGLRAPRELSAVCGDAQEFKAVLSVLPGLK